MELRQLRYFVLLAEELNFTRAAERGNVAQPALSRQIRKLEDELGVPLVDRTTRRVKLTNAGFELVERARRILDEVEAVGAAAKQRVALLSGRVAIGMTQTPGPIDAPALLAAFHRLHPAVELLLREDLSVTLAERLRADDLDLALVSAIAPGARRGLALQPLASERLLLVVSRDHPAATRTTVTIRDLRHERFVAFPEGATIREAVDNAAATAGFAPRVAFESNDIARTRALVAQGLGVAVLPESDVARPGPEVAAVQLRGRHLVHHVAVAWRDGRRVAPAPAEFLRALIATGRSGRRATSR